MGPDSLEPGDLIATHSSGLVGRLIRFGEKKQALGWRGALWHSLTRQQNYPDDPWYFNHIAIYAGQGVLIEALARGLTSSPIEKYAEYKHLPLRRSPDGALAFASCEYARTDPYGWLEIASIIVNLLTSTRLQLSWGRAMVCSAFGARCWEHSGIQLLEASAYTTLPSDLVKLSDREATLREATFREYLRLSQEIQPYD